MFNYAFIAESDVKELWKSINSSRNYGKLSTSSFFIKHGVKKFMTVYNWKLVVKTP